MQVAVAEASENGLFSVRDFASELRFTIASISPRNSGRQMPRRYLRLQLATQARMPIKGRSFFVEQVVVALDIAAIASGSHDDAPGVSLNDW